MSDSSGIGAPRTVAAAAGSPAAARSARATNSNLRTCGAGTTAARPARAAQRRSAHSITRAIQTFMSRRGGMLGKRVAVPGEMRVWNRRRDERPRPLLPERTPAHTAAALDTRRGEQGREVGVADGLGSPEHLYRRERGCRGVAQRAVALGDRDAQDLEQRVEGDGSESQPGEPANCATRVEDGHVRERGGTHPRELGSHPSAAVFRDCTSRSIWPYPDG